MQFDLPNLVEYDDRLYVRVKRDGRSRKIRITEAPGTDEFFTAYRKALDALKSAAAAKSVPHIAGACRAPWRGWRPNISDRRNFSGST